MEEKKEEYVESRNANYLKKMIKIADGEPSLPKLSLWLDSYNDIFSDFDPRPYSKRGLSDDFVVELKKVGRETLKKGVELNLLIPKDKRDYLKESIIKRRLRQYFKKQHQLLEEERKKVIKQGFSFIMSGVILMVLTTFVLFRYYGENFFLTFLSVVAEPAGWFLFWEGLNLVIFEIKKKRLDFEFNKKLAGSAIYFHPY